MIFESRFIGLKTSLLLSEFTAKTNRQIDRGIGKTKQEMRTGKNDSRAAS